MITEVRFPEPAGRAVLHEFAQRQGDFAIVAAAVQADITDGTLREAGVVVGGVGPLPVRIDTTGAAGQPATNQTWHALAELAAAQVDPPSDTHGSGDYRARRRAGPGRPLGRRTRAGRPPGRRTRRGRPLGRRGHHPQGRRPAVAGPGPVRG